MVSWAKWFHCCWNKHCIKNAMGILDKFMLWSTNRWIGSAVIRNKLYRLVIPSLAAARKSIFERWYGEYAETVQCIFNSRRYRVPSARVHEVWEGGNFIPRHIYQSAGTFEKMKQLPKANLKIWVFLNICPLYAWSSL